MREYTPSGTTLFIEYPDYLVFLGDNNTIRVSSSIQTDTVGARITIREPAYGEAVLDYWSETNEIVFLLNDSLLNLYNDNISAWTVLVECYSNSTPQANFSFYMKVFDGKSFPDRSHGATTTIYWTNPDDLKKLQIFSYEGGTATFRNSTFPLEAGISNINLSGMTLGNEETIYITSTHLLDTTPEYLGSVWTDEKIPTDSHEIKLKYSDWCEKGISCILYFKDCDGCTRVITGLVSKETDNSKGTNYGRIESIYRNGAYRMITSNSKVITVGFKDIDAGAYLSDLMYSNNIRMINYNGDFIPVSINSNKLETKDFDNDFEIEITINNEN